VKVNPVPRSAVKHWRKVRYCLLRSRGPIELKCRLRRSRARQFAERLSSAQPAEKASGNETPALGGSLQAGDGPEPASSHLSSKTTAYDSTNLGLVPEPLALRWLPVAPAMASNCTSDRQRRLRLEDCFCDRILVDCPHATGTTSCTWATFKSATAGLPHLRSLPPPLCEDIPDRRLPVVCCADPARFVGWQVLLRRATRLLQPVPGGGAGWGY
jgi:hypothetical protein